MNKNQISTTLLLLLNGYLIKPLFHPKLICNDLNYNLQFLKCLLLHFPPFSSFNPFEVNRAGVYISIIFLLGGIYNSQPRIPTLYSSNSHVKIPRGYLLQILIPEPCFRPTKSESLRLRSWDLFAFLTKHLKVISIHLKCENHQFTEHRKPYYVSGTVLAALYIAFHSILIIAQ